jgi:heat shock protein HtpX
VLAHELSHIANRDVAVMTVASFFSMLAAFLMRMGMWTGMMGGGRNRDGGAPAILIMIAVSLITYVLSTMLILLISRYREFAADRGAAVITGAPENLMSALQKIASDMTRPQRDLRSWRHERVLHHPDEREADGDELFLTHPPLEKRLARLGRSQPRWAARSQPEEGAGSATSSSGGRSSRAPSSTGSSRSRLRR